MLNLFLAAFLIISLVISQQVLAQTKVPCTCRYQGEDFVLGEEVCMDRTSGSTMARCEMVLNNTSWKFTEAPCPVTNVLPSEESEPTEPSNMSVVLNVTKHFSR